MRTMPGLMLKSLRVMSSWKSAPHTVLLRALAMIYSREDRNLSVKLSSSNAIMSHLKVRSASPKSLSPVSCFHVASHRTNLPKPPTRSLAPSTFSQTSAPIHPRTIAPTRRIRIRARQIRIVNRIIIPVIDNRIRLRRIQRQLHSLTRRV